MIALKVLLLLVMILFFGVIIFSLPATFSLPFGDRPGIEKLTLDEAVKRLQQQNMQGFELAEQVRRLIITRMQYCRRNSFDSYKRAFKRGYGYCMQQAYAMQYILHQLGLKAKVVQSMKCRFHDGSIGGHAWVRVTHKGKTKDVDPTHVDLNSDKITFIPLKKVTGISPLFRAFTLWGSAAVNAYRYYVTGRDA